jgi:hypothetical protein
MLASLIETCKLHGINPQAYLTDVLTRLVNNWPNRRLGELLPWSWTQKHPDPSSANHDGAEAPLTDLRPAPIRATKSNSGSKARQSRECQVNFVRSRVNPVVIGRWKTME